MKRKAILHNILGAFSNFAFLFLTGIVLLPYYFRFISADEWGIWLGGISFLSLFTVLEANISFILTQQLGEKWVGKQRNDFANYLSAALIFGLLAGVVIAAGSWLIREDLAKWAGAAPGGEGTVALSLFLYAVSLSFTLFSGYINSVTQVFLKTLLSPVLNLLASAIGIAFTLALVRTQGILAVAGGLLVRSVLYSLMVTAYSLYLLREHRIPFRADIASLGNLLRQIGWPFASKVAMTSAMSIQNFLVAAAISAGSATTYDVTRKLPLMVQMLMNMVTVSTFTSFSLHYSEQKNGGGGEDVTRYYFSLIRICLLLALAGVLMSGGDFVDLWVGSDKYGGDLLLLLFCLAALSDQFRLMVSQQYYALGKFGLTSVTDTLFALSFLVLAFLWIPGWKMHGVALASIGANVLYFLAGFFLEKKFNAPMIPKIVNRQAAADIAIASLITGLYLIIIRLLPVPESLRWAGMVLTVALLFLVFVIREKALIRHLQHSFLKPLLQR